MVKKLISRFAAAAFAAFVASGAIAQTEILGPGQVLGNSSASNAPAGPETPTAIIDRAITSTRGSILFRGATAWSGASPGTAGFPWTSNGVGADPTYQAVTGAAFGSQSANAAFIAPNGSAGNPTFRALVGADLPNPGASSKGGVQSLTCSSNNWFSSLSTAGVLGCTQPSFASLTGSLACTQTPALTGDITTSAGACATTLATVNSNVGTFGNSTNIPTITVDGKGRITAASQNAISAVTSVNGNTGAITGVDTNTLNAQTANYPIVNTDCGKTIQMSGGSFTVTLPAVTGFSANCTINVKNASTTRGQKLSGFPTDLYTILYPNQFLSVKIVNGAWATAVNPGRYKISGLIFNIDASLGNDSNDGLATGSGGAFLTLNQCRAAAQVSIDTISQGNGGVTCLVPSGQTFQEFVSVFFPLVGGGTLIFQGNGGAFTWKPINSGYAVQFGDLGVIGLTNVTFSTTGVTTPAGFITGHNYGVVDINAGVTFNASSPAIANAMSCDFDAHFNINNGFSYVGTFTFLFQTCQNSQWNFNGTQANTGTTSLNRYFYAPTASGVVFQGNVTWTGTGTLTTSAGLATGNSVVNTGAGAPPGGAVSTATGGQYCTSLC